MNFFKIAQSGTNKWYLYIATIIIVVIATQVFSIPAGLWIFIKGLVGTKNELISQIPLSLILIPFLGGLLTLVWAVKKIHNRNILSVFTSSHKFRLNRSFVAFGLWMLLMIISELASAYFLNTKYTFSFDASKFVILLVTTLLLIPPQTAFEEVMFRGYFSQGLGLILKNRAIVLCVTSIGFGLMHLSNNEIDAYGTSIMLFSYILMGFTLGFVAMMDEGIEASIGLHTANNLFGCLFVTFPDSSLKTDALLVADKVNPLFVFVATIIFSTLFIFLYGKLFKWSNYKKLIQNPLKE